MSSYGEFLEEAKILTTTTESLDEDLSIPITVPHSRPRGTWGQWMKEFTIPPDVLDLIVRRYDSKSWSATGGRSRESAPKSGEKASSSSKPLSWSNVASGPRAATKEGGATSAMRGVTCSRPRSLSSGRARALLQRPETPQESPRRPGEIGRSSSISESPTSPESRQPLVDSQRHRKPPPTPPPGFGPLSPSIDWPPTEEVSGIFQQASLGLSDSGGPGVKARGNVWEQRAVKRYENGRESGQDRVTEHEEEEEEPGVVVEGEESSDQSSCFFSAHNSQEGGEEEEREEEEVLGVFFCKRERSLRGGGSHDVDLITWEDDEEGYERGEEVAGVDDGRDKSAECGDGSLPLTTPTLAPHTGGETTESCCVGGNGSPVRRFYKKEETEGGRVGEGGEEEERGKDGNKEREEEEGGEEEEGEEMVKMKCGCTLDQLEAHMGWGFMCRCSRVTGGRADPKLPPWANDDHTLVLSNIPTTVSEEDLEEDIQAFGEVLNCSIVTLPNEAGLHTAYVRMKERDSCQWIISCYHGIPYGDGTSKPMVCYTLQQQEPSLDL